jgi:transcriptional regulator with XRE-family HTH domain
VNTRFRRRLRQLRKEHEFSQEQLGARAKRLRLQVIRFEMGQQEPTLLTLRRLARALGVTASALLD